MVAESLGEDQDVVVIHDALEFGHPSLNLAIPEGWKDVISLAGLVEYANQLKRPLRIVTKYKNLVTQFFEPANLDLQLVSSEGTVEIAPAIGGSGVIVIPVSYVFDEELPRYRKLLQKIQITD